MRIPNSIFFSQTQETIVYLTEEVENFYKVQVLDEANLLDRIFTLVGNVSHIAQHNDVEKIHQIAIDVKRVWKSMKECQEQGLLLNERQKLFGVPITPYDHLTNLIKEFEPYQNLWVTASGKIIFCYAS